jgi:hypothetical protein
MFPEPPNSVGVADEVVVPVGAPAFRWAVFATSDSSADPIAFYTRALGRGPDEDGCRWTDPAGHTLTVLPVEDRGKVPPSARPHIPSAARTLVFMVHRREGG